MTRPRKRLIEEDGPDTSRIAARLAELRRQRGITQVELAKKLGVAQSVVSDYERGRKRLHGELILRLSRFLEISADDLLGARASKTTDFARLSPFLRRLRHVHRLSRREQKALLLTIDAFLSKAS